MNSVKYWEEYVQLKIQVLKSIGKDWGEILDILKREKSEWELALPSWDGKTEYASIKNHIQALDNVIRVITADLILEDITADIKRRHGLNDLWNGIEDDVKFLIEKSWKIIVKKYV